MPPELVEDVVRVVVTELFRVRDPRRPLLARKELARKELVRASSDCIIPGPPTVDVPVLPLPLGPGTGPSLLDPEFDPCDLVDPPEADSRGSFEKNRKLD